MTEVRTTSATGGAKGVKEQRHDLLPRPALDRISEVYAFGAEKYADHNWRKRYEWSKSYAAAQRHMTAFWDGEDADEESGLSHLAHAGFHIFALLTWISQDGSGVENEYDDRWTTAFERARLEALDPQEEEELLALEQARLDREAKYAKVRHRADLALDGLEPEPTLHGRVERDSVLIEGGDKVYFFPTKEPDSPPQPLGPEWKDVGWIDVDGLMADLSKSIEFPRVTLARFVGGEHEVQDFGPDLLRKRSPINWLDDYDAKGYHPR